MAYSITGIVNLALLKIGVKRISSHPDSTTPQGIDANDCWEYIRDEVLAKRDWKFAKTRVALAQNATAPAYLYDYAYTLPSDFLRLCLTKKDDTNTYPSGAYDNNYYVTQDGIVVFGTVYSYSIETLSDGTMVLMTNYDNTDYDLYIPYIKKVTDATKYSPLFIKALSYRLAAELAMPRTEGQKKFESMMLMYEKALQEADELNSSMEYVEDETGPYISWADAGR